MTRIRLIVIHCSATTNGRDITAEQIHGWHKTRGWDGIGYHYVIKTDGTLEHGRPEFWPGAHASGHNRDSLGICLIGTDSYSPQQHVALEDLIRNLKARYPAARICGHRDLSPDRDGDGQIEPHEWLKTCPGFDVAQWLRARGLDE